MFTAIAYYTDFLQSDPRESSYFAGTLILELL